MISSGNTQIAAKECLTPKNRLGDKKSKNDARDNTRVWIMGINI